MRYLLTLLLIFVGQLAGICGAAAQPAHYIGTLIFQWDIDGRHMTLMRPFEFDDADGTKWPVPKGAKTDGASIPEPLWSIIGAPFTGVYRNAAVVHDYYCDVRTRTWQDVDRMFYDAMLTSGVNQLQAKIMYAAVYYAGPRWDGQTINNNNLNKLGIHLNSYADMAFSAERGELVDNATVAMGDALVVPLQQRPKPVDSAAFQQLADQIKASNPSLDEIDKLSDAARK